MFLGSVAATNGKTQSAGLSSNSVLRPQEAAEHLSVCSVATQLSVQVAVQMVQLLQHCLELEVHSRGLVVKMQSALV